MDKQGEDFFESIKKKAEKDKDIWNQAQEEELYTLPPEVEDEIMERMFLVYYVEEYSKQLDQINKLKETINEIKNHSTYSWHEDRRFINSKINELIKDKHL